MGSTDNLRCVSLKYVPSCAVGWLNETDIKSNIYLFLYFTSLLQTVRRTDTRTEVAQFFAHKRILSANLRESVSK